VGAPVAPGLPPGHEPGLVGRRRDDWRLRRGVARRLRRIDVDRVGERRELRRAAIQASGVHDAARAPHEPAAAVDADVHRGVDGRAGDGLRRAEGAVDARADRGVERPAAGPGDREAAPLPGGDHRLAAGIRDGGVDALRRLPGAVDEPRHEDVVHPAVALDVRHAARPVAADVHAAHADEIGAGPVDHLAGEGSRERRRRGDERPREHDERECDRAAKGHASGPG